jgi:hypothetical protein
MNRKATSSARSGRSTTVLVVVAHARTLALRLLVALLMLQSPAIGGETSVKDQAPRVYGALSDRSLRNLLVGYPLALQRVRDVPSCGALFEQYGDRGIETLVTTLYVAPTPQQRRNLCGSGVLAFGAVGSPVTWLCPQFGDLDRRSAAAFLIHEALHHAGMPESSSTPGVLTSQEITAIVRESCGL